MGWGFLAICLPWICWFEAQSIRWPPKHSVCIACPQRMDGRSWLCLDTAQLLVQDVAPIICCNCSERLLAASWDVRDCSGQVVFCPPWGSSGLCEGMVLARILENVVCDSLHGFLPCANPFGDVLLVVRSNSVPELCPFPWGVPAAPGRALVFAVGFSEESQGARHPTDPRIPNPNIVHTCTFSSASPLIHTPPFLALYLTLVELFI